MASNLNNITLSPPPTYLNSHLVEWKDKNGKTRFFRCRIYERCADGTKNLLSFTKNQWEKANPFMGETLVKVDSVASDALNSTKIEIALHNDQFDLKYQKKGNPTFQSLNIDTLALKNSGIREIASRFFIQIEELDPKPIFAKKPQEPSFPLQQTALPSIGSNNESGNDCFLNALLQAKMLTDPDFEAALRTIDSQNLKEFKDYLEGYRNAQAQNKRSCSGINTLRAALEKCDQGHDWIQNRQEDPNEVLTILMKDNELETIFKNKEHYLLKQTNRRYWNLENTQPAGNSLLDVFSHDDETGWHTLTKSPPSLCHYLPLSTDQGNPKRISQLIRESMLDEKMEKATYELEDLTTKDFFSKQVDYLFSKNQWEAPTKRLTLSLERFGKDFTRVNTPVSLESRMILDGSFYETGQPATYELVSFIAHWGGKTSKSGHYVAYVKENGRYYLLNDSQKEEIVDDEEKDWGWLKRKSKTVEQKFLEAATNNAYIVEYKLVD